MRFDATSGWSFEHDQPVHYRRERSTARRHRHPDLRSGRGDAEINRRVFTFALIPAGIFGIGLLAVSVLTASGIRISSGSRTWRRSCAE